MNRQADQLEDTVDFAFANPGGIPAGEITFGEVYAAFPFRNVLTTTTLTGAQSEQVLEQGASGRFGMVQVSGLRFAYDPSLPVGRAVQPDRAADLGTYHLTVDRESWGLEVPRPFREALRMGTVCPYGRVRHVVSHPLARLSNQTDRKAVS